MRAQIVKLLLTLLAYLGNTEPDQDTAPGEIVVHEDITTDVAEKLDTIATQKRDKEGWYRTQIELWRMLERAHPQTRATFYSITLRGSRFVLVRRDA